MPRWAARAESPITVSTTSARRLPPPSRSTAPKPHVPTRAMPMPNMKPPMIAPLHGKADSR